MRDIRAHSLTSTYACRYVCACALHRGRHTRGAARRRRGRIVSIVRGGACRGPDFPSFTHGHCCSDVRPLARVIVTRALRTKTRFIMFSPPLSAPFHSIPFHPSSYCACHRAPASTALAIASGVYERRADYLPIDKKKKEKKTRLQYAGKIAVFSRRGGCESPPWLANLFLSVSQRRWRWNENTRYCATCAHKVLMTL